MPHDAGNSQSESYAFHCPGCQARIKVPSTRKAGKKNNCPKCKTQFIVPLPGESPRLLNAQDDPQDDVNDDPFNNLPEMDVNPLSSTDAGQQLPSEATATPFRPVQPAAPRPKPNPQPSPSNDQSTSRNQIDISVVVFAVGGLIGVLGFGGLIAFLVTRGGDSAARRDDALAAGRSANSVAIDSAGHFDPDDSNLFVVDEPLSDVDDGRLAFSNLPQSPELFWPAPDLKIETFGNGPWSLPTDWPDSIATELTPLALHGDPVAWNDDAYVVAETREKVAPVSLNKSESKLDYWSVWVRAISLTSGKPIAPPQELAVVTKRKSGFATRSPSELKSIHNDVRPRRGKAALTSDGQWIAAADKFRYGHVTLVRLADGERVDLSIGSSGEATRVDALPVDFQTRESRTPDTPPFITWIGWNASGHLIVKQMGKRSGPPGALRCFAIDPNNVSDPVAPAWTITQPLDQVHSVLPGGGYLLASVRGGALLVDIDGPGAGRPVAKFGHLGQFAGMDNEFSELLPPNAIALSPDGKRLALIDAGGRASNSAGDFEFVEHHVSVWDLSKGRCSTAAYLSPTSGQFLSPYSFIGGLRWDGTDRLAIRVEGRALDVLDLNRNAYIARLQTDVVDKTPDGFAAILSNPGSFFVWVEGEGGGGQGRYVPVPTKLDEQTSATVDAALAEALSGKMSIAVAVDAKSPSSSKIQARRFASELQASGYVLGTRGGRLTIRGSIEDSPHTMNLKGDSGGALLTVPQVRWTADLTKPDGASVWSSEWIDRWDAFGSRFALSKREARQRGNQNAYLFQNFEFPSGSVSEVRKLIAEEILAAYTLASPNAGVFARSRPPRGFRIEGPPREALESLVDRPAGTEVPTLPVVATLPVGADFAPIADLPAKLPPIRNRTNDSRLIAKLRRPPLPDVKQYTWSERLPIGLGFDASGNTCWMLAADRIDMFELSDRTWSTIPLSPQGDDGLAASALPRKFTHQRSNPFAITSNAQALVYVGRDSYRISLLNEGATKPGEVADSPLPVGPACVQTLSDQPKRLLLTTLRAGADESSATSQAAIVTIGEPQPQWIGEPDRRDQWADLTSSGDAILTLSGDGRLYRIHRFEQNDSGYREVGASPPLSLPAHNFKTLPTGYLVPRFDASPSGRWLGCAHLERLFLYDANPALNSTEELLRPRTLKFPSRILDWLISPDETVLVVSLQDKASQTRLVVLDIETEQTIRELSGFGGSLAWRPGTSQVAVASACKLDEPQRIDLIDVVSPSDELAPNPQPIEATASSQ